VRVGVDRVSKTVKRLRPSELVVVPAPAAKRHAPSTDTNSSVGCVHAPFDRIRFNGSFVDSFDANTF